MENTELNRRQFLGTSTAFVGLGCPALTAQTTIGDWTVTSVSDGTLTLPAGFIFDPVEDPALADLKTGFGLGDTLTPPCNVTLLQNGTRNVLVDVGAGAEFQSSAGQLTFALAALGLAPDDITDVIFTHAHPDHLWGLLDDFDDLAFWNASYQIGAAEWAYWTDPNTVSTIGDARATFAVGASRRLERIADQVTFFADGDEILPGLAARATFGHTPGHMAFEVRQGSNALMILGDCIGNHHAAFVHPAWHLGSDQDPPAAAATRARLLDQLAHEQTAVLGFHLPGDGLGRVERKDSGYRFVAGL